MYASTTGSPTLCMNNMNNNGIFKVVHELGSRREGAGGKSGRVDMKQNGG
jgi:hypothetical protein